MESPDPSPPEYKYVLLSFIEAEKTNFEKIENRLFLSSFFLSSSSSSSSSSMRLTREP